MESKHIKIISTISVSFIFGYATSTLINITKKKRHTASYEGELIVSSDRDMYVALNNDITDLFNKDSAIFRIIRKK